MKKLKYWNFENDFSLDLVLPLAKKGKILKHSDRIHGHISRGFRSFGPNYPSVHENNLKAVSSNNSIDPIGQLGFFSNTSKINIFDFPLLKMKRIAPFLHFSLFVPISNIEQIERISKAKGIQSLREVGQLLRLSAGMGLFTVMPKGNNVEFLYNFFHISKAGDKLSNFQIRWSD